jgi:hypothetical protein
MMCVVKLLGLKGQLVDQVPHFGGDAEVRFGAWEGQQTVIRYVVKVGSDGHARHEVIGHAMVIQLDDTVTLSPIRRGER